MIAGQLARGLRAVATVMEKAELVVRRGEWRMWLADRGLRRAADRLAPLPPPPAPVGEQVRRSLAVIEQLVQLRALGADAPTVLPVWRAGRLRRPNNTQQPCANSRRPDQKD